MGFGGVRPTVVVIDEAMDFPYPTQQQYLEKQRAMAMANHGKTGIPRNRGAQQRQANFDRAQLDGVNWADPGKDFTLKAQFGVWKLWVTERIAEGTVYVTQRGLQEKAIVVHPTTWKTISIRQETVRAFIDSMTAGASGMKYISMDSGPYGEAARLEQKRNQAEIVSKDALVELTAKVESLLVQASGLAGTATPVQASIFVDRLTECQFALDQIEERVRRIRSNIELAADAVMDAVS